MTAYSKTGLMKRLDIHKKHHHSPSHLYCLPKSASHCRRTSGSDAKRIAKIHNRMLKSRAERIQIPEDYRSLHQFLYDILLAHRSEAKHSTRKHMATKHHESSHSETDDPVNGNLELILALLPQIDGISFNREYNCFSAKVPSKFANLLNEKPPEYSEKIGLLVEKSFSVKHYGFRNAWIKAVTSLYINIAHLIFDLPLKNIGNFKWITEEGFDSDTKSELMTEIDSKLSDETSESEKPLNISFGKAVMREYDNHRSTTSMVPSNTQIPLTSSRQAVSNTAKVPKTRSGQMAIETDALEGCDPLLVSTRNVKRIPQEEEKDPKVIAESLKPWHPKIFWIPSICRWRTLYYDTNRVKHTKTFTPAVYGGIKEAYQAALDFRNMIDNMDRLTQSKIRRNWTKSNYDTNTFNDEERELTLIDEEGEIAPRKGFHCKNKECVKNDLFDERIGIEGISDFNQSIKNSFNSRMKIPKSDDNNMMSDEIMEEEKSSSSDGKEYDENFLSGLDTSGLYIPIPLDWKTI